MPVSPATKRLLPHLGLFVLRTLLLATCFLVACSAASGPRPMLEGDGFFDAPWPSDLRAEQGHAEMDEFPNRANNATLDSFLSLAEGLSGFSNNGAVYFRFHAQLDDSLFPSPSESLESSANIFLLNVDPSSTEWAQRVPVEVEFESDLTMYQPGNLLAVRPLYGFPLDASTRYAVVVREPLARVTPEVLAWWSPDHEDSEHYASLQDALLADGTDVETVAVASVFTTQDPVGEMADFAALVQDGIALPAPEMNLALLGQYPAYDLYEGRLLLPVFQSGERPYATEGGAFFFEDSRPSVYEWEWARFSVTVPTIDEPPESGWPVCVYSHGTGGDYITHADRGLGFEPANLLSRQGVATFAIDQPLHGVRATASTDPSLHSFNYVNPVAGRTNFRQGALDQVFVAELLGSGLSPFVLEEGEELVLDTDRVVFFGHSQGALVGALAAPFVGHRFRGMALSAAGGGLALTLVLRKDIIDIAATLEAMMDFSPIETVDTFHPIVTLVQWLTDVTDPLNYGPYWHAIAPPWDAVPAHVLLSEGLEDEQTPSVTTEALSAAARVPILEPAVTSPEAMALRGLEIVDRPTTGNVIAFDGEDVTSGLAQYDGFDHHTVFENSDAAHLFLEFLTSGVSEPVPELGL